MELRRPNSDEGVEKHRIIGVSSINHSVRVNLKLSLEEYVLLDFIFQWNKENVEKNITFRDYYKATGFIRKNITDLFAILKERKLLVWDNNKNRVDVDDIWKAHFSTDGQFERLWKIHHKGNKKMAMARLPKVLKKISIEELIEKLVAYKKWCAETNTFEKDLSTWMNPETEHWNNVLTPTKSAAKSTPTYDLRFKQ